MSLVWFMMPQIPNPLSLLPGLTWLVCRNAIEMIMIDIANGLISKCEVTNGVHLFLQNYYASLKIPVLIVGNKADLGEVMQDYILQPSAFCAKYKLPPPHSFSCSDKVNKEIYIKLATMAAFP